MNMEVLTSTRALAIDRQAHEVELLDLKKQLAAHLLIAPL